MLEITFFASSKYLQSAVKVGSKTNIPGGKIGCHLTILYSERPKLYTILAFLSAIELTTHLASTLEVARYKTKQNSVWLQALTMPLIILNFV